MTPPLVFFVHHEDVRQALGTRKSWERIRFLKKYLDIEEIFCNFANVQWNEELQGEFLILLF